MNRRIAYAQSGPRLGNQFLEDVGLNRLLQYFIPKEKLNPISDDLTQFGDKVHREYLEMSGNAELFQPKLERFNAWGERIDKLHLSEGWKFFHKEAAKEGLVAIPYDSKFGEHSRVYQACKLFLFIPSGGLYGCPLAMTDGAAFVLRKKFSDPEFKSKFGNSDIEKAYHQLISRDPKDFITSGQWMTEKRGGSDVSGATDTVAVPLDVAKDTYSLHGYKWFTSATDSSMSLTLARIVDSKEVDNFGEDGRKKKTSSPLSMFFLRMRKVNDDGEDVLNGLEIVRLKDKMGTKQLPTAELILDGTEAIRISEEGRGVSSIVGMLHITRYHNAISSVAYMRRMTSLAMDFARRRYAFGSNIVQKPLHMLMLRSMELDTRGNLLFVLEFSRLLGLVDVGKASSEDAAVLRVISSLLKLFTAKEGVRLTSEGVECFGGVGVMENSHIPVILRDSQVLPIWEGTTNILSLDLLRACQREPEAIAHLENYLRKNARGGSLLISGMIDRIFSYLKNDMPSLSRDMMEANARKLSFNVSRLLIASVANRVYQEAGKGEFETGDKAVLDHWLNRMEKEYEALELGITEKELREYESLFSNDLGQNLDKRGERRSRL
mmetsp:Transcript_5253/g.6979  ORF Transcript_5253/g.6979 Transcript_5253/m.6979 type:complete len:606 (+) Transcript_5253:138-1955(+)